ncbi:MAG: TPM domain-containing protein, partial [Erythrobacter sp.]|nr:TPM domain-containing protein [Erythrobacter sp.]
MGVLARLLLALGLAGALLAAPAAAQPAFPELTGRVVDEAGIIPDEVEAQLTAELAALEEQSQRQLVIATIPDLGGYDIADYGYQLGRAWGIGDESRNDGALLIVAPNDRKVRIEVGYGLEGYLTDALSSLIIQNAILPRFREGDMTGGIVAGTNAIVQQLQLPPEEAARIAEEAGNRGSEEGGFPVGTLIWLAFMFFFFVLPIIRGSRRRRKYRAKGKGPWGKRDDDDDYDGDGWGRTARDIILWEVGSA